MCMHIILRRTGFLPVASNCSDLISYVLIVSQDPHTNINASPNQTWISSQYSRNVSLFDGVNRMMVSECCRIDWECVVMCSVKFWQSHFGAPGLRDDTLLYCVLTRGQPTHVCRFVWRGALQLKWSCCAGSGICVLLAAKLRSCHCHVSKALRCMHLVFSFARALRQLVLLRSPSEDEGPTPMPRRPFLARSSRMLNGTTTPCAQSMWAQPSGSHGVYPAQFMKRHMQLTCTFCPGSWIK